LVFSSELMFGTTNQKTDPRFAWLGCFFCIYQGRKIFLPYCIYISILAIFLPLPTVLSLVPWCHDHGWSPYRPLVIVHRHIYSMVYRFHLVYGNVCRYFILHRIRY
jgi:hypothetical protein